jgi:hypothetical protein
VRDLHRPGQYGITKDRTEEKLTRLRKKEMQYQALISDGKLLHGEQRPDYEAACFPDSVRDNLIIQTK